MFGWVLNTPVVKTLNIPLISTHLSFQTFGRRFKPLSSIPKTVKHTQTICRLLSVFNHFARKGFKQVQFHFKRVHFRFSWLNSLEYNQILSSFKATQVTVVKKYSSQKARSNIYSKIVNGSIVTDILIFQEITNLKKYT